MRGKLSHRSHIAAILMIDAPNFICAAPVYSNDNADYGVWWRYRKNRYASAYIVFLHHFVYLGGNGRPGLCAKAKILIEDKVIILIQKIYKL